MISIIPEKRVLAKQLAMGMAGSFAGVFLFQLLCIPILAIALLGFNIASWFGRPHDMIIVTFVMGLIVLPLIASMRGFYLGWRVASEWAIGRPTMRIIDSDWLLGPLSRIFRKITHKNPAQQATPSSHK
jgi:hypothetical protein